MTDKLKGSNKDQAAQQPAPQQQPGEKNARRSNSNHALDKNGHVNREKLAENQRKLNVGPDHKTPEMKRRHRGTFP